MELDTALGLIAGVLVVSALAAGLVERAPLSFPDAVARDGDWHPLCEWGLLADDEQDESEVLLDVGWGAAWAKLKVVLCRSGDILRVRTVWLREGCEPFDWTCEPNSTALRPPFRTAHYFAPYGRVRPDAMWVGPPSPAQPDSLGFGTSRARGRRP